MIRVPTNPGDTGEIFKYGEFAWEVHLDGWNNRYVAVTLCRRCLAEVDQDGKCKSASCGFQAKLHNKPFNQHREEADVEYHANSRRKRPLETLGELPVAVKDADEDKENKVAIKLTEHGGRKLAIVYIIDKATGEKVQMFLDITKGEIRYDDSNTRPTKLIKSVLTEFPEYEQFTDYKEDV
ncbi:MAG: hypothetical protein JWO96_790 [Candidatus Saccharibacteria bacterium]|nr:hypothetical protein [Candidatus Saccharibacteria bacterium]